MLFHLLDALSVSQYITSPYSLGAFVIAAVMTYFIRQNYNDRKKIESAKEGQRANLIRDISERLHLKIDDLPPADRVVIVKKVLTNRVIAQVIIASVIVIVGLLVTFLVYTNLNKDKGEGKIPKEDTSKGSTTIIEENHGVIQTITGDSNTTIGTINIDTIHK